MKIQKRYYTKIILLFTLTFFASCATPYLGSGPQLSLTGEQAQQEYEKYELEESMWSAGSFFKTKKGVGKTF